jgi:hypothetical protein
VDAVKDAVKDQRPLLSLNVVTHRTENARGAADLVDSVVGELVAATHTEW